MLKRGLILTVATVIVTAPAFGDFEVLHNEYGSLSLLGLVQARHTYVFTPDGQLPDSNFSIARARIGLKGNVSDYSSYLVLLETKDASLLDTWGRLDFAPIGIIIGQFKQPYGIEYHQSSAKILTINRALVSVSRDGCTACTPGYDIGAGLNAKMTFGDYGWVKPMLTVYNGTGRNAAEENSSKDIAFGFFANPINMEFFKGFQVFGSYVMAKPNYDRENSAKGTNFVLSETTTFAGGAALEHPAFTFQGEYQSNTDKNVVETDGDDVTYFGYYAQGSYRWYPGLDWLHAVEPLVKYDFYNPNDAVNNDGVTEITGGMN
ncbi:MAG: hypothetical protein GY771_14315, partial [bacterium]|nr:hypothetical protein [bacterium]